MRVDELRSGLSRAAEDVPARGGSARASVERRAARQRSVAGARAAAVAVAVLMVGGVAVAMARDNGPDGRIAAAVERTIKTGSARVSITKSAHVKAADWTEHDQAIDFRVDGVVAFKRNASLLRTPGNTNSGPKLPSANGEREELTVDDQLYVRYAPGRRAELGIGTPWVLSDLGPAFVRSSGEGLLEEPMAALRALRSAGVGKRVGAEVVGGVATAVYAVDDTVRADDSDEAYPFQFRVWIDDAGVIRRLDVTTSQNPFNRPMVGSPFWSVPGGRQPESIITTRFEFTEFGVDAADVVKPPADQVSSARALGLDQRP